MDLGIAGSNPVIHPILPKQATLPGRFFLFYLPILTFRDMIGHIQGKVETVHEFSSSPTRFHRIDVLLPWPLLELILIDWPGQVVIGFCDSHY